MIIVMQLVLELTETLDMLASMRFSNSQLSSSKKYNNW